jgi:hypothetical protein
MATAAKTKRTGRTGARTVGTKASTTGRKRGSARAAAPPKRTRSKAAFRSAAELREVLDGALTAVNADRTAGSLLNATKLRLRLDIPDLGVVLNLAASDRPDSYIEWQFDDVPWKPKLELKMDSEVANAWLQGKESIAVAIARRRVSNNGDARCALLYLPATKLIQEQYRRLIRRKYRHLAL